MDIVNEHNVDVAEIQQVIWAEKKAFSDRDFNRWAECFVHDERLQDVAATQERGIIVHQGWAQVSDAMRKLMRDNPTRETLPFEHQDHQISLHGDMAWATFYSRFRIRNETKFPAPECYETRVLERHDGCWRIVYTSFAFVRHTDQTKRLIQVESDGSIIWTSNETLTKMERFEGLAVSHGKLRAAKSGFDNGLQNAFVEIGEQTHLFCPDLASRNGDRALRVCSLGEDQEGRILACIVFARNGVVNVAFGDDSRIAARVEFAAEVYGLSPRQRCTAIAVSTGLSLPEAAEKLGVGINTVRTHLSRIYQKIGVQSQAAMVQRLLSVGTAGQ